MCINDRHDAPVARVCCLVAVELPASYIALTELFCVNVMNNKYLK